MAIPAALAGIAAHNQGKFWQMHDAIFAMNPITAEKITAAAEEIGLDMDRFNLDRASEAAKQRLDKDISDGANAQVTGTPTMFVNGRLVENRSPDALQQLINQELAKAKKGSAN